MKLEELFGDRIKRDEPLKNHTTYRLGGPADFYFTAKTAKEASSALAAAKEDGLPVFVMGGGSNLLASDSGFRGLVISYAARAVKIEGARVVAESGAVLYSLVRESIASGLTGLEWAAGIPGTVGGAVRGNAGAYGGEIKDSLETVQAIDLADGQVRTFGRDDCAFAYRESIFKRSPWLITLAVFSLAACVDKEASLVKTQEIIAKRRAKQPLEFGNAGSVFKSFVFGEASGIPAGLRSGMPPEFIGYGRIPAAWIIEKAGLKGKVVGGARISEKHGNYFVNTGMASAEEVRELIAYAKMRVKEGFGISLEEEIQYLGF
jgi:UDP-N-acetylmuramate dehydrogenase